MAEGFRNRVFRCSSAFPSCEIRWFPWGSRIDSCHTLCRIAGTLLRPSRKSRSLVAECAVRMCPSSTLLLTVPVRTTGVTNFFHLALPADMSRSVTYSGRVFFVLCVVWPVVCHALSWQGVSLHLVRKFARHLLRALAFLSLPQASKERKGKKSDMSLTGGAERSAPPEAVELLKSRGGKKLECLSDLRCSSCRSKNVTSRYLTGGFPHCSVP